MRRTAPGYVQLPGAAGHASLRTRSPASSPLARSSTTSATYFDDETGSNNHNHNSNLNASVGMAKGAVAFNASSSSNNAASSHTPARPPNSRTKSNSSIHSASSLRSGGSGSSSNQNQLGGGAPPSNASAGTTVSSSSNQTYSTGTGHQHIRPSVVSSNSASYHPGISPAGSGSSISTRATTTQADEIEASLRQWRNHVFPSLQAGNYVSPGQETPDRDPIHPLIEPILPSIFATGSTNTRPEVVVYNSPREFLQEVYEGDEEGGEENERSWRMEMLLGQTEDMLYSPQSNEGLWMGVWSGKREEGTRLLEFCLMKLPSRPLVLISPIPICILPTAFLQDRMLVLLSSYLSLPAISSSSSAPFSLIMGPTRVVEAFLLHFDGVDVDQLVNPGLDRYRAQSMCPSTRERELSYHQSHSRSPSLGGGGGGANFDPSSTTWSSPTEQGRARSGSLVSNASSSGRMQNQILHQQQYSPIQPQQQRSAPQVHHASTAMGRTVKPLLHTRIAQVPPLVSLSEGFVVRLADEKDDLGCLAGLFRAYSATLDHYLDDYSARKALAKAMANKSVWIYHLSSQTFQGLSLIAGFLTTERRRRFRKRAVTAVDCAEEEEAESKEEREEGRGSIAITAIFVDEAFRGRGVAESLVRTATRYYLTGEEVVVPSPVSKKAVADKKKKEKAAAASSSSTSEETEAAETEEIPTQPAPVKPKETYDYLSVYVDPRNESTCRVFSRVGYGIMEKEEQEEIPIRLLREALEEQYRMEWEGQTSRRSSLAIQIMPTRPPSSMGGDSGLGSEQLDTPMGYQKNEEGGEPFELMKGHNTGDVGERPCHERQDSGTGNSTPQATASTVTEVPNPLEDTTLQTSEHMKHVHYAAHDEGTEMAYDDGQEEDDDDGEAPIPFARSVEEWQVVSLKRSLEEGRRARGIKRDEGKRLSMDGPWN